MNNWKISPSLIAADYLHLGDEIREVSEGGADYIHVDVMDGHFVPNLTLGPEITAFIKKATALPLDVHLMISNAEVSFKDYIQAGAAILTVHVEAVTHLHRLIQEIKKLGVKAGVAVNPATPIEAVSEILPDIDVVNMMSVNPGFYGQAFIPAVLAKISRLREIADKRNPSLDIEVDGGVKLENIAQVASAGANVFVSGAGVFKSKPYKETIRKMKAALTTQG